MTREPRPSISSKWTFREKPFGPRRAFTLPLRGAGVLERREFLTAQTAVVVCDMWDRHWCTAATRRLHPLACELEPFLELARASGVQIIHAPSDVTHYYHYYPQRRRMLKAPPLDPPAPIRPAIPPAPIDDSDGGCASGDTPYPASNRQHLSISIRENDVISDDAVEIYRFLRWQGTQNLIYTGVHSNICILHRPFGVIRMSGWGFQCVVVRDLVDAIYNPAMRPYVSEDQASRLVIEYIEEHWCPSVSSEEAMAALL